MLVAGCSVFDSLLGPDKPKPKDLEPIAAPITVRPAWNSSVGAVGFPLTVAVNGNVLTLGATDGNVLALDAEGGRVLWRVNVGGRITAGVGSDGTTAAVVTREGELVALEGGAVKWKKPLAVRVATAPLVAGGRVFVLGVDRSVRTTPPTASAVADSAAGRSADAVADRRHRRVQEHAHRRPGAAHCGSRSVDLDAALGGTARIAAWRERGRAPRRPGRPGRSRRRSRLRTPSRPRSVASMHSSARSPGPSRWAARTRSAATPTCCSAPTPRTG
jgi:hypothetical protein